MSNATERDQRRKNRRNASPEEAKAKTVRYARARNRALTALSHLHPAEYAKIFADELEYAELEDQEAEIEAAKAANPVPTLVDMATKRA